MRKLKWPNHADLATRKTPSVGREEYLDYMTFRRNDRPLFTEIWGPIVGLKEEWEEQGATPAELDFSAFTYRGEARAGLLLHSGRVGGHPIRVIEETDNHRIWTDELGRTMKLPRVSAPSSPSTCLRCCGLTSRSSNRRRSPATGCPGT